MPLALALFIAGVLTILLPCILPLLPIVLGVSIAGRSKWRPLLTVLGMLLSFVGSTFLLLVVLRQFASIADYIRIGTYTVLLLFGVSFLTHRRVFRATGAVAGALFFAGEGIVAVLIAAVAGFIAVEAGSYIATRIQRIGTAAQQRAREGLGEDAPLTALFIGLTLGLVWVPCAGPALGLALSLVRDEPGLRAAGYLFAYGLGTAVPLLLVGYGGQAAVHSVRALAPYTGRIKQVAGVALILTAVALQFRAFESLQIWLVQHTGFGDIGTRIEERLFGEQTKESSMQNDFAPMPSGENTASGLPRLGRAPLNIAELGGAWLGSEPLDAEALRGKVVLIDFWTYSCINCIRTLPYIQGYWERFGGEDFVLIGVHTPEFTFEQRTENVQAAMQRHGLTYPVVQDNDYRIWRAYANRYWPAKYLVDAEGAIRYTHFGEGAYEETADAIQALLREAGSTTAAAPGDISVNESSEERMPQSPETYLGERSWPSLANAAGEPIDAVITYTAPAEIPLHRYALVGSWQLQDGERQVLQSDTGQIRMHWQGGEVNLVMGPGSSSQPPRVSVFVDGEPVREFTIEAYDLYQLFDGAYGEHDLRLEIAGVGTEAYAFTFGQ